MRAVVEKGRRIRSLVQGMLIDSRPTLLATERGPGCWKNQSLGETFYGQQDGLSTWAIQLCLHRAGKYHNLTRDGSTKYMAMIVIG